MHENNSISESNEDAKKQFNNMKKEIVDRMNSLYSTVDPNGRLVFDDIFTKKSVTYSGSEEQEYYYSRLIALNSYFEHEFPLIIDCFRSGEISTQKEEIMIGIFKKIEKQVILTSTLKKEEYDVKKYDKIKGINVLDYSINQDSKILNEKDVERMSNILNKFNITVL